VKKETLIETPMPPIVEEMDSGRDKMSYEDKETIFENMD